MVIIRNIFRGPGVERRQHCLYVTMTWLLERSVLDRRTRVMARTTPYMDQFTTRFMGCIQTLNSSTRCWMQLSRQWPIPTTGAASTPSMLPTIAGLAWPAPRTADTKLIRSVLQGCSHDNAACEGFFGRLKTELFYPRDWKVSIIEQRIEAVDSYIRRYNEKRIKIFLGSLSLSNTDKVSDLRDKAGPSFSPHPPCCDLRFHMSLA